VNGLLLSFYSDDFTGATDVLDALARAGLTSVLFLEAPTPAELRAFGPIHAVGVAGGSRVMTPQQMSEQLPPIFRALLELGAPILHYKVCSTFDSSPEQGSIGRAIELGKEISGAAFVPLVVGCPALGRYTAFGTLFARAGADGAVFRLDRHPVMSRHPSTPMREADLRRHLQQQTTIEIELVDLSEIAQGPEAARTALGERIGAGARIVMLDLADTRDLPTVGELIWDQRPLFVTGSSGVEYALIAHWGALGIPETQDTLSPLEPTSHVLVVSGSASSITDAQIAHALEHGYVEIALETEALLQGNTEKPLRRAVDGACSALRRGASVIIHTARGPDDPRLRMAAPREPGLTSETLGRHLGLTLVEIHRTVGFERAVVVGGDTSVHAVRALGATALTPIGQSAPGAPLCRAFAPGLPVDGLELVLKGGQIGEVGYFEGVRDGVQTHAHKGGT
jgi:3-oxoisoapionate kinase